MKRCTHCKIEKDESEFYKDNGRKDGLQCYCKECHKEWQKNEWYKNYQHEYYIKNKEHIIKNEKRNRIKRIYNLTDDDYNLLFEKANDKCEICGSDKMLGIDHNHITDKVRGLLCRKCNTILGLANDNIKILEEGIKYLKKTHSS